MNDNLYPIIDVHASWLAFNPVQGCPNECKYCFLRGINMTHKKPIVLCSPNEAVELLIKSPYYTPDFPICFFSQSDAFSTEDNVNYVIETLKILHEKKIKNPKIFVTKCSIPERFITLCEEFEKSGEKFIFYLSYSGLNNDIEVGIDKNKIQQNFIKLAEHNQKIIHYWRPILPQNSSIETVKSMLDFAKKYAIASVVVGLKVQENILGNFNFWPEIENQKEAVLNAECVWPKEFYDVFFCQDGKELYGDYPIFQSNSCALALALDEPDRNAFWQSNYCKNINNCPSKQTEKCRKLYDNIDKKNVRSAVIDLLKKLNYNTEKVELKINDNELTLQNIVLSQRDITYLTQLLHMRIVVQKGDDIYWNSSLANKKPLII